MRNNKTIPWLLILLATVIARPAAANGANPGEMRTGSLLMRTADGYANAPLLDTDVSIRVNGLVARVSVMQEFRNPGSDWVEGTYVFPLPDGAAVDQMRLYVGDRFIEGEIREKEQARKDYEAAKQEGRKTSLIEQQRANLFTTSVANIAPGEAVIVEIEYLETVRYDDGTFSLRYPMTLTPRYMPGAEGDAQDVALVSPPMVGLSQAHRISLQARINAGMPLAIIASRYHPVNVAESAGSYNVTLAGGQAAMDHDFELLWRPVASTAPRGMAFAETVEGEPYYLIMVMPPDEGNSLGRYTPREMIFIIDTSGSMHGVSLEQAKQALLRALDGLQPGDLFNVIEFNSHPTPLFVDSVTADPTRLSMARNFVARLKANGGTEMHAALNYALRNPPQAAYLRQVIFITDGAVGDEEALFKLIATRLGDARLFTVGIGSAPNSWFMRKAAETGRGTFTTISALQEVGEKMDRLFRKLEHPQMTDIDLQWPGGVAIDAYPRVVPDLYLGEPVAVRVRASGGFRPGDTLRIAGNSVAGSWTADVPLRTDAGSPGVAALWARARIAGLLDEGRRGADEAGIRDKIVATALRHHLVSRHTSLVAVDKTPARPGGEPLAQQSVPNLGARGQVLAAFPTTATGAPASRLFGYGALLFALLLLAGPRGWGKVCHVAPR